MSSNALIRHWPCCERFLPCRSISARSRPISARTSFILLRRTPMKNEPSWTCLPTPPADVFIPDIPWGARRSLVYRHTAARQRVAGRREGGREGGTEGCTHIMYGRSLIILRSMAIDPRMPTMPGRSTSGFPRSDRHLLAPSAKYGEGVFICCLLCHLTIDHASLSRRSTVPTPDRGTSNIWAFITLFPSKMFANIIPFLFRCLSLPYIS